MINSISYFVSVHLATWKTDTRNHDKQHKLFRIGPLGHIGRLIQEIMINSISYFISVHLATWKTDTRNHDKQHKLFRIGPLGHMED